VVGGVLALAVEDSQRRTIYTKTFQLIETMYNKQQVCLTYLKIMQPVISLVITGKN